MNLVRWTPFQDITLLQSHLNRLFDNVMKGRPGESDGTNSWMPPADICETDNELVVTTDLPAAA